MKKSSKLEQLRVQLARLDSSLVPASSRGSALPTAIKVNEGEDRVFGFT